MKKNNFKGGFLPADKMVLMYILAFAIITSLTFLLLSSISKTAYAKLPKRFEADLKNKDLETINLVLQIRTPTEIEVSSHSEIFIKDRILKVKPAGHKTVIMGSKEGFTTLLSETKKYNIQILNAKEWLDYIEFDQQMKNHPSLKIIFSEEEASLVGELLIPEDYIFVLDWLESSDLKPKFKLSFFDEIIKKQTLEQISNTIGLQVNDIDSYGQIHINKQANKEEMERIHKLGFQAISSTSNGLGVGTLEIEFVNISDSDLKNLTPILPTEFQWTFEEKIKILSQIFNSDYSKLESIKKRSTKISLMLFENESAVYHSGGEFAIQQRSIYRNDVQWKTYGLFVEALPISINKTEIKLNIKVKMSYVVSTDLNQPSLSQDSWQQNLRLEKNKVLVVTNSLTNMFARDKKNHLLFNSIPILGTLFKSKNSGSENSNIYMMIKLNSK